MHKYTRLHATKDEITRLFDGEGSCVYGYAYLRWVHSDDSTYVSWVQSARIVSARHEKSAATILDAKAGSFVRFTPTGSFEPTVLPLHFRSVTIEVPEGAASFVPHLSTILIAYMQVVLLYTIGVLVNPVKLATELEKDWRIAVDGAPVFCIDSDTCTGVLLHAEEGEDIDARFTLDALKSTLAILAPRALARKESAVFPLMLAQEDAERAEAGGAETEGAEVAEAAGER